MYRRTIMENEARRAAIIFFLGLCLVGYFFKGLYEEKTYRDKWELFKPSAVPVQAEILSARSSHGRYHHSESVIIKYADEEGGEHTYTIHKMGKGYKDGAVITVWYDKNAPGKVMAPPEDLYGYGREADIFIVCVGAVLMAAGVVLYLKKRE